MSKNFKFNKPRGRLFGVCFILIVLIILSQTLSEAQTNTVKIGALLTLTGPLAVSGSEIKNSMELAAEDINKAGGIKALGWAKIEIAFGDSQARPDIGTTETERLIEREKCIAIIDQYPSVVTLAASAMSERLRTPFLAAISYADKLTERGFKYFFQLESRTSVEGLGSTWYIVEYMVYLEKASGRKFEKVAIVHEATDYGQSAAKAMNKFVKAKGKYKIVEEISHPSGAADLTPVISKLKAAKPDVILQASYLADSILLMKTADRLGFYVPVIDLAGKAYYQYIKSVGELAECDNILGMWDKNISPQYKDLYNRFKAKCGLELASLGVLNYQAVWVVKEAFELAKKADRESLRDAMTKIRIEDPAKLFLPYNFIKFGDDGMNTGGGFIITQVQDQDFVTVFPEKYAYRKVKIHPKWWK